jgi:hypothetical protein
MMQIPGKSCGRWNGQWLLMSVTVIAVILGGCAASEVTREEAPTPANHLGDLQPYRGQRSFLRVRHASVPVPGSAFDAVMFADGLVVAQANGCRSLSTVRRRRLSADELSSLRIFLSSLRQPEETHDCSHSAFYEVSWGPEGDRKSLVDGCDGRAEWPQVKEAAFKVLELIGMSDLPKVVCDPSDPGPGVLWRLVGPDWHPIPPPLPPSPSPPPSP